MGPAESFRCSVCGEEHPGPPLVYDTDAPAYWYGLPPEEREERAELTSDQCVIDGQHFFLRGNLEIPILGSEEKFVWGLWVSVSEESFWRATELWRQEGRESEMPYFGWLSTAWLPGDHQHEVTPPHPTGRPPPARGPAAERTSALPGATERHLPGEGA